MAKRKSRWARRVRIGSKSHPKSLHDDPMAVDSADREVINVSGAAALLNVGDRLIREWINSGGLPAINTGNKFILVRRLVLEWAAEESKRQAAERRRATIDASGSRHAADAGYLRPGQRDG